MVRITLDTSVYIGTLNSRGGGSRLLALARAGEIRIDAYQRLRQLANVVTPTQTLDIKEDPPDNRILECAMEAGSECVVTWDKDLLRLKEYAGITILTPAQFLERWRDRSSDGGTAEIV